MAEWWNGMNAAQQVFISFALAGSLIVVIQFILSLVGLSGAGSGDTDTADTSGIHTADGHDIDVAGGDAGGDAPEAGDMSDGEVGIGLGSVFSLFTIRGVIALFAVGGWVGVALAATELHIAWVIVISVLVGMAAGMLISYLYKVMARQYYAGNVHIRNAVGSTGTVYLTIPPAGKGSGKVSIMVQDRLSEFDARTEGANPIPTGAEIRVVGLLGESILIVEPLNKP